MRKKKPVACGDIWERKGLWHGAYMRKKKPVACGDIWERKGLWHGALYEEEKCHDIKLT